jgi:hypothetical protein
LVPRYEDTPKKGWGLFDLQRAAKEGEITVDPQRIRSVNAAYGHALSANPFRGPGQR